MNEEINITTEEININDTTNLTEENTTTEQIVVAPNQVFIDYGNCFIASLGLLAGLLVAFCFGLGFNSSEK